MKYIVGDIHGEIIKLKTLIDFILKNDSNPKFVFIGDYIDKSGNPKDVLTFLNRLKNIYDCIFLKGNHEYYWELLSKHDKKIENYLLKYGGIFTIKSFNSECIYETRDIMFSEYEGFFKLLKYYWQSDLFFVSHSGVNPKYFNYLPNSIPFSEFLFNRYSFIKTKQFFQNKRMIFGHTGFYSVYYDTFKIGIDTSGWLLDDQPISCFCIENSVILNSNKNTYSLNNILLDRCSNIPRVEKKYL